ncbi:glycosyltransferase [Cellulomonas rhizosphaerae]|uniref:D-inositol 3-phosphate glycosyltransferase n=1 Tax=Cellulomonas rhizosphaerae TaxID=2293719 RepID=A0A413RQF6_9CELL|nr:glycosyltransferase [Cellulomonas rhizosphaerae]RHA44219.1 glycosyltransferase family 4 protein [Cellulomonas rhizosphaerae]
MSRTLDILVVAPLRFPLGPPHAGGLESMVWNEVRALRDRGHRVGLIAAEGSDQLDVGSPAFSLPTVTWGSSHDATDATWPTASLGRTVHALDRALDEAALGQWDVVLNHCLHPLPLRRARDLGAPVITTLHTPPEPALVAAAQDVPSSAAFVAVSEHTRAAWARAGVTSQLLHNGVRVEDWPLGPGGEDLVWFGRIVPEKAPHLAIEVARRLGRRIVLAGRVGDERYMRTVVAPMLGRDARWGGHLDQSALARLVGHSATSVVTSVWAEPFGLVAPESLCCGTPVAGFAVGGLPEVAGKTLGMSLNPLDDLDGLVAGAESLATRARVTAFRSAVRASARRSFSLDARVLALEDAILGVLATSGQEVA